MIDRLLPHRIANHLQTLLLLAGMVAVFAAVGALLGGPHMMIGAVVIALGLMLIAPRLSPRLVLRLYNAVPLTPADAPPLYALMEELARRAELEQVPRLYYIPSRMMNAFTVGTGAETTIAVTDGLLRRLPPGELTAVLAHELSHVRHHDIQVLGLADLFSRMTGALSLLGQLLVAVNLPLILLGGAAIPWSAIGLLLLAPVLSALLQLALSRTREFDADLGAVALTGDPRALATALERLEQQNGGLERVVAPGNHGGPSMLRTHPQTGERIRRLKALAGSEPLGTPEAVDLPPHFPEIRRTPRRRHLTGLWH